MIYVLCIPTACFVVGASQKNTEEKHGTDVPIYGGRCVDLDISL